MKEHAKNPETLHQSVLLAETLEFLAPARGGVFVDATLGLGGHAEAILLASSETKIIGIDQDA
ncbi:MAG: 16S rRNA (cytosine(1402)-N(4))-methyltransferase, partial [Pyrinomonadaceae bacterium]